MAPISSDYALVAIASGQLEAEILRGLLEAHGVLVWTLGESAGSAIGLGLGPLGEVEIRVPAEQEPLARELLGEYFADRLVNEDPADE